MFGKCLGAIYSFQPKEMYEKKRDKDSYEMDLPPIPLDQHHNFHRYLDISL